MTRHGNIETSSESGQFKSRDEHQQSRFPNFRGRLQRKDAILRGVAIGGVLKGFGARRFHQPVGA